MKTNEWLESSEFLSNIDYDNKYYIFALNKRISNYIKNAPVPIATSWDPHNKSIWCQIGANNKHKFVLNEDIYYDDFVTLIEKWAKKFYPRYSVIKIDEIELSDEEILEKVKSTGISLDDAILLRKKIEIEESAFIERVFILEDEFILNKNNERTLYNSGTPENPFPLSEFMKNIRKLERDEDIRNFIHSNSTEIRVLRNKKEEKLIDYPGKMMFNFIKINRSVLENSIKILGERTWLWENYRIIFDSPILELDCRKYLDEYEVNFTTA